MAHQPSTLSFSDDVLEQHRLNLLNICRVCSEELNKKRCTDKCRFSDEFLEYFKEDIRNDIDLIHPSHVCDKHRLVLHNLKVKENYSTDLQLVQFEPHSDNCRICAPNAVEHSYSFPTKRKKARLGGPGRGNKCKGIVISTTSETSTETACIPLSKEDQIVEDILALEETAKYNCLKKLVDKLPIKDLTFLTQEIGENQSSAIFDDAVRVSQRFRTLPELANFNINNFVDNNNLVVRAFINGCCKVTQTDSRKNYLIGLTMEMLYKMRYPSCIAPLSFMRNLATYVGHDKAKIMKINGASSPGGSYTTITNWVKSLAAAPPVCPSGDIINVFDNDQVIGKTYTVHPQNKVRASVITNRVWIQSDTTCTLQSNMDLLPGNWLGNDNMEHIQHVARQMRLNDDNISSQLDFVHRKQLTYFIDVAIREVLEERIDGNGESWKDTIDLAVETNRIEQHYQFCGSCHTLVLRGKRNCTSCHKNLKKSREEAASTSAHPQEDEPPIEIEARLSPNNQQVAEERYSHVQHNHPEHPPAIKVADPVFTNPNSYESLRAVLRKIGEDAGIRRYGGTQRYWTVVCCDGLPYHLCMKLIQQTFICNSCKESIFGIVLMKKHLKQKCPRASIIREFDWVLLKIGGGHYESNMMKSFMELNWEPFMSDLCHILSFQSPLAQQSAKRCDSHHKTWAILVTFHLATLKELVVVYVRHCVADGEEPTPTGFVRFAHNMRHIANFAYMYDQVCKYSQAIINFRMGTRRNNAELIRSSKHTFKEIFHGRNHPIYSIIEINDTLVYHVAPKQVKEFLDKNAAFSKSGDNSKGQDADYILEETNQETKQWIPKGVPEDEMWRQVCRNLPHLKVMNDKVEELTGVSSNTDYKYRKLEVSAGVHAWRCHLRETRYLETEETRHTTTKGEALHGNLSSFRTLAAGKRSNHISVLFDDQVIEDTKPVFVTEKEERDIMAIENHTIPQIKKRICDAISNRVESEEYKLYFFTKFDKTKGQKKSELLKLYYEIDDYYRNQPATTGSNSEGDE